MQTSECFVFSQQKKQNTGKGGKKKKQVLKFTLDCTHPVEDGIMDAANFVRTPLIRSIQSINRTLVSQGDVTLV